eukprot:jgi/Ulvmu1/9161/UM005_0259.1
MMPESCDEVDRGACLASDAVVSLQVSRRCPAPKPPHPPQRRAKFFRPRRRQQIEELLGSRSTSVRTTSARATPCPPLLQGITCKRWSFRGRNRVSTPDREPSCSSHSSASSATSVSTSPSSFLPAISADKVPTDAQGASQMPLLVRHASRPHSDSDLAPANSSSQVPLLLSRGCTPSSVPQPQPSPRRTFHLSPMRYARPPAHPSHMQSLRNPNPPGPPSTSTLSPRSFTASVCQDVLSITEAHALLPRLTLLRSRRMRTPRGHQHRNSSSSGGSANAAPRKAMSRVDAFNSSRLTPASSAVAIPSAPFFELEDVTPDSQCGALRNWLAQPDEMSTDFRRAGVTGPLGSTSGLTGALTGAITGGLHGLPHLPHTPPSCCSTQRASSLAVSPLRSLPPRRAGPTLSSLNSSMMSSAAAGDESAAMIAALQAALTRAATPHDNMQSCAPLDAHLDTITQEETVESTVLAPTEGAPSAALSTRSSEDLDAMSESTMGLDTAMLPSVLPSCSAACPRRASLHSSIATSLHGQGSQLSAVSASPAAAVVSLHRATARPPSVPGRVPAGGSACACAPAGGSSGASTPAGSSPRSPASSSATPRAFEAQSDVPSCTAAVLHQPSQLLSGQQDSCFDTIGSHRAHPLLWDSADAAPGALDCASEKHVSDSTIISYIDGTTGVDSPALISCSEDSAGTRTSKCSSKGKRHKWVTYLLCSCKAD